MREFVVTMLVKAESEAAAADAACERLNSGETPDYVGENVCEQCNQLPDYFLHLPAKDCAGCEAPHDHHEFKYKTLKGGASD